MSYHLEYVDKPGMFDEIVEQDGVRVLIDSKALFSIIGSEMDWQEDALRYVGPHSPYRRLVIRPTQRQVRFQEPQHQGCLRMWRVFYSRVMSLGVQFRVGLWYHFNLISLTHVSRSRLR